MKPNECRYSSFLWGLIILFLTLGCVGQSESDVEDSTLPKIAILGLGLEASVFSPALTQEEDFRPKYGTEIFDSYPFFIRIQA